MKQWMGPAGVLVVVLGVSGCGATATGPGSAVSAAAPMPVTAAACSEAITGAMRDFLTGVPVARGLAVLETGARLDATVVVNFNEAARAGSDAGGAFRLCVPGPLSAPAVVVLLGFDAGGLEYPAFVEMVPGAVDLGNVVMGGCGIVCDTADEERPSTAPVVVEGRVTSAPSARAGIVAAQDAVAALDGSRDVWGLSIPGLEAAEGNDFETAASPGCAAFCAPYRFTLPAENPVRVGSVTGMSAGQGVRTVTVRVQQAGVPRYGVYATASGCVVSLAETVFAEDGKTFLTAQPGATVEAADVGFTGCR